VERLAERQVVARRSYAGFNPARRDDVRLFAAVLDGNNLLRGFRNGDIRGRIFPSVQDAILHRRQEHAVGRLPKRLRQGPRRESPADETLAGHGRWSVSPRDVCQTALSWPGDRLRKEARR
jgi:hypothetical protein